MSLLNLDEINRLVFKRSLELLQTFNPGWAEHNDSIPLKAPTTSSGSQWRTRPLSPTDDPLWDEENEPRQGKPNVHNRHHSAHCLWTFLISEGQLIMKALGVGRSKGKPTAVPAPRLPPLCLLNGFACWGTATKRANRSRGAGGGGGGGRWGRKAKDFFVCAPALV